ncbi:MAG: spermidine/putrescine ABC transporter substrate-binding protein [Solirubrobacterales bacterium]|nr:spermidine/putrescine ABC transporter substrate-binding protein [Solirubrobacterales bacterium]
MPDRPDELHILVPESRRADIQRMVTRRQALIAGGGAAAAAYLAGCGGSTSSSKSGGGDDGAAPKPGLSADASVEDGDLLLANWIDYSDPANYKGYTKEVGPKIKVSGFGSNDEIQAKLRAGGAKYDVISPTGYAVKTMADLGLIQPLTHELIPNIKNVSPAFTETDYDPGNKYSVPKDYGVTSFYWLTDKVSEQPASIKDCMELLKTPKFKDLSVNFLEGGTQVMAIALAALGYSINSEDQGEIDAAKQLLVDVKPNVDTVNSTFIERATRGEIDFGMGWNGDIRRAIEKLAKKDREMVFLIPEGNTEFWVDNWVIPADAEHPVAAHKWINYVLDPAAAGREMNYHQYPVPVEGITGVEPDLANDPVINVPDEKIQGYESQIETAKGLQQRNRAYTEFKAA